MRLLILGLLLGALQEEPEFRVRVSRTPEGAMQVRAKADLPEGTRVLVEVGRVVRRWDGGTRRFREVVSGTNRRPARAIVQKGRIEATLKGGVTGTYLVTVTCPGSKLGPSRAFFGSPKRLFHTTAEHPVRLREAADLAIHLLEKLARIVEGGRRAPWEEREGFMKKLTKTEEYLERAESSLDLTATVALLREVFYQIHNAQAWEYVPMSEDDEKPEGNSLFLRPGVTIAVLREEASASKRILSRELGLSVATLLEGSFTHQKPEAARKTAEEALQLLRKDEGASRALLALVEGAAKGETPVPEILEGLRKISAGLLK